MISPAPDLTDKQFIDHQLVYYTAAFPKKELHKRLGFVVEAWDKKHLLSEDYDIQYGHLPVNHAYDYELNGVHHFPILVDVKCSFDGAITHTLSDDEINTYKYELGIEHGYQVIIRSYSQTYADDIYHYTFNGTYSLNSLWKAGKVNPGYSGTWCIYLNDLAGHEFIL